MDSKVDYSPAIKKRNISEVDVVDVNVNVDIADPEAANEELLMTLRARILLLAGEILHLSAKEAEVRTTEYLRFMQLKKDYDEEIGPSGLAPSSSVDALWHAHLLDSKSYRMLQSYFSCNMDHNPIKREQPEYAERLSRTKKLYMKKFYAAPPGDIWSDSVSGEGKRAPAPIPVLRDKPSNRKIVIFVRSSDGTNVRINCTHYYKVQMIKMECERRTGLNAAMIELSHNGIRLDHDSAILAAYDIPDGDFIVMTVR